MTLVCAITFAEHGRLSYATPGEIRPAVGDQVLVETSGGPEVAQVMWAAQEVPDVSADQLAVLVGYADAAALARDGEARKVKAQTKLAARRLAREHGLTMKISAVDYLPEGAPGGQVTIYFSSPARVDFRQLVRDLGATLRMRIELRQLSARDEAKIMGGIGGCGRDLCCATFLTDFEPVTLRMVRDQDLPVNPLKISGACGKLLCCLKYEHPLYASFKAEAPAIGSSVETPEGDGVVVGHDVPRDQVAVRLSGSGKRCGCSQASVCAPRKEHDAEYGG